MMSPISIHVPKPSHRRSMTYLDPDGCGCSPPAAHSPGGTAAGVPVKEGNVRALYPSPRGRTVRLPVVLKVYSSSFEHYAVVSQDNVISRDRAYINLKNCVVQATSESATNVKPPTSGQCRQQQCKCPRSTSTSCAAEDRVNANNNTATEPRGSSRDVTLSGRTSPPPSDSHADAHTFRIIPNNADGHALTFCAPSSSELEQWLAVLRRSPPGDSCCMSSSSSVAGSPPKVVVLSGSPPVRNFRISSPGTNKRSVMPPLEEE